jgi:uncharacterized Zn finger protein
MKAKSGLRFDIDTLRDLAGGKTFERGQAYDRDGSVRILILDPARVLAQVAGTEDYRTEVIGRGRKIAGNCSCPAFEDRGFCKHMVATALAANAATRDGVEEVGSLARIRDHLKTKSVDDLADMIVKLAEHDPALLTRLEIAAAAAQGDPATLEARLQKALDAATRTGTYIDYDSAEDWAARVNEALGAIEAVSGANAELALKLAMRAIDRIAEALENIDDSDGYCSALLARAQEIHLAAAPAARQDPIQLARDLFAREMNGAYDEFYAAAAQYAAALGEEGLAEYRRLAEREWQNLPPRSPSRSPRQLSPAYDRLIAILDYFAACDGDTDRQIELRRKDLSSPHDYVMLAEFCRAHGRVEEALRYAEEGLWIFEDGRQDERLVFLAIELLAEKGRVAEAEAHLWRAFEKSPSRELYGRLRKIGGETARARALRTLESRCTQPGDSTWREPVNLLVRILVEEKAFDAAWTAVRKFGGSSGLKEELARASEKTHPAEAIAIYEESVERLAKGGNYAEAAKLIARLANLRTAAEQATYVAALKARHERKRNFMKLLGQFSEAGQIQIQKTGSLRRGRAGTTPPTDGRCRRSRPKTGRISTAG